MVGNSNQDIPSNDLFSLGKFMNPIPIGSMYGMFTYIWRIFMVNVGQYTTHGSDGIWKCCRFLSNC